MFNARIKTNKKVQTIFMVGFLFLVFLATAQPVKAATSTVRGYGWLGDTYREIYFNCLDDIAGDRLDMAENFHGELVPPGFRFFVDPCTDLQHAVYISENGNFSGKAWNASLGFISFSGPTPPPGGYGSVSPFCDVTCNASNECWACYNEATQKVYGYAQVDESGQWIRLDSALDPPVGIQNCDLAHAVWRGGYGIEPGDFVGNASSMLGALSFNCESESGGSTCAIRDYKVYISNLTLGKLTAPNLSNAEACDPAIGATAATLTWCKKSGKQTAYEIVVNNTNNLSTSTAVCWSGIKTPNLATPQYNLPSYDPDCDPLDYGKNYYWWVRAYDENNVASDWYQYNTNSAVSTDGNPDGIAGPDYNLENALTFTTYKHEFPSPYFSWAPFDVLVGTTTIFNALTLNYTSKFYTTGEPANPQSCYGANCRYQWRTTDNAAIISVGAGTTTIATTSIIFTQATGTSITLGIWDTENYYCSTSTTLKINYELPLWREVKAQ